MAVLVVEVAVALVVAKLVGTLVEAVEALVGTLVEAVEALVGNLAEAVEALVGNLVLEQVDQTLVAVVAIVVD